MATPRGRALVLGNSAYQALQPVETAAGDARMLAAALKKCDFKVALDVNVNWDGMDRAVSRFLATVR
ncbi:MAG: caspase family protein, partial [Acidobacteria bacterium]|nr:caspase family protein [Acidobacteriota bacterium]